MSERVVCVTDEQRRKIKRGKPTKCVVLVDGQGIPLGGHTYAAIRGTSPTEITLLDKALG